MVAVVGGLWGSSVGTAGHGNVDKMADVAGGARASSIGTAAGGYGDVIFKEPTFE